MNKLYENILIQMENTVNEMLSELNETCQRPKTNEVLKAFDKAVKDGWFEKRGSTASSHVCYNPTKKCAELIKKITGKNVTELKATTISAHQDMNGIIFKKILHDWCPVLKDYKYFREFYMDKNDKSMNKCREIIKQMESVKEGECGGDCAGMCAIPTGGGAIYNTAMNTLGVGDMVPAGAHTTGNDVRLDLGSTKKKKGFNIATKKDAGLKPLSTILYQK